MLQTRGMATEKQSTSFVHHHHHHRISSFLYCSLTQPVSLVKMRITATSNIAKITKSMKMVSAAKMRGAQNRLNEGRPFTVRADMMLNLNTNSHSTTTLEMARFHE